MITLKEAKQKGLVDTFINQHHSDPQGDQELFDKVLEIISHPEKLKSTQETSSQDSSGN